MENMAFASHITIILCLTISSEEISTRSLNLLICW